MFFVFSTTWENKVNFCLFNYLCKQSEFKTIFVPCHSFDSSLLYYSLALNSQISLRIETKSTWKTVFCSSLKERLCPTFTSSLSRDYHLLLFSLVIKWFPVSPICGKPFTLALYKLFKLTQRIGFYFHCGTPCFSFIVHIYPTAVAWFFQSLILSYKNMGSFISRDTPGR